MRVMRVAHEAPGLSSSVNIGASNLGNALDAAAGGAGDLWRTGICVCAGDGRDYRWSGAAAGLVDRASASRKRLSPASNHRLGKGKKTAAGRPRCGLIVYAARLAATNFQLTSAQKWSRSLTGVAIVDVVGVFPNVNGQQRLRVGGHRGAGVAGGDDSQPCRRHF